MWRPFRILKKKVESRRLPAAVREAGQLARWRWLDLTDRVSTLFGRDERTVKELRVAQTSPHVPVSHVFVDISVISQNDAGTGIQRVVRSLRDHLPGAIDNDAELKFLSAANSDEGYLTSDCSPLNGAPGSLFFGLDFATDTVFRLRNDLRKFKADGGQLWFLLHDLLPLSHPNWFTPSTRVRYRRWLRVCAGLADGFLCVSPVVAAQLREVLIERYGLTELPQILTIQLGSNLTLADRLLTERELPAGIDPLVFKRAALVVGTLEPRKGHSALLDSFELLWSWGHQIPLVLIGRAGWNTAALQERIRRHSHNKALLFWFDDVDDQSLQAAYRHCRMVIVPSLAEGFGLPLDEALASGAPVLARDIAVFRRHAGTNIQYFPEKANAEQIATAILETYARSDGPRTIVPLRRWDSTANQVAEILLTSIGASEQGTDEQRTDRSRVRMSDGNVGIG